jgi:hemerythrin superfamily protein
VPDAIDLILADHRTVDELFEQLNHTQDASYAGLIFDALTAHDEVEQHVLYPFAAQVLGSTTLLDQARLDHSRVKMLMEQARYLERGALVAVMTELQDAVQTHVQVEESELLPQLRAKATPAQLDVVAARMEAVKQRVG